VLMPAEVSWLCEAKEALRVETVRDISRPV
jgi:hypothetical protein